MHQEARAAEVGRMTQTAETPRIVAGAFPRNSARGGTSEPTVAKGQPEQEPADVVAGHWGDAKRQYLANDFPAYATPAWRELPFEDPRKLAGLMHFAEMWRLYGLEIADELNELLAPRKPMYLQPSLAELNQRHDDMIARNRQSGLGGAA
jgi:hypothetical protein